VTEPGREPLVSAVILSWNRCAELRTSLLELRRSTYANREIIVVDNGSIDDSVAMVRTEFPEARLILLPFNLGIEGFNVGILNAAGEYVVVLDDDSYPAPGAIARLVSQIERDPTIAAIGARILHPRTGKVCTKGPASVDEPYTSFWGGGAILRRSAVVACGMYDRRLFIYTNEYDLAVRLMRAGHGVRYDPEVVVYHSFAETSRPKKGVWYWARNEMWFNLRYVPLRFLPLTIPRSAAWMLMSSRHSLIEMLYRLAGLVAGIATFRLSERDPVSAALARMLLRHHWTFVPPVGFIVRYLWRRRRERAQARKAGRAA